MINRVVPVLVTFHQIRDLHSKLSKLLYNFEEVILVDNGSLLECDQFQSYKNLKIILNNNKGGLAGAYNRALGEISKRPHVSHVVFLDDDTNVDNLFNIVQETIVQKNILRDYVGVGAQFIDRNSGVYGGYLHYKDNNFHSLRRPLSQNAEVAFVINSMTIWQIEFLKSISGFDEDLFVDHIDTDVCLKAMQAQKKLLVIASNVFEHAIGERKTYSFMGKTFQSGCHSAFRRFLIAKNSIILLKRYKNISGVRRLFILRIVYESVGILLVENDKIIKLRAIFRGVLTGLRNDSP